MSFIEIKDPTKREQIVQDYLKTIKNIQNNSISKRLAEQSMFVENAKVFAPVIKHAEKNSQKITNAIQQVKDELNTSKVISPTTLALQDALSHHQLPVPAKIQDIKIGSIARNYLSLALSKQKADTTFGIRNQNGDYYIGNKPIKLSRNNILMDNQEYIGTPGLWSLITEKRPRGYDDEDLQNYSSLIKETAAMHHNNNPDNQKPKSNKSAKWKEILKPIWNTRHGRGLIVIPSDPNALLEKFDLLAGAYRAGNKTVRTEIVSILDELKRQGVIDNTNYYVMHSSVLK